MAKTAQWKKTNKLNDLVTKPGKNGEWWLVVSMVRASRQDAHFFWLVLFYYLYKVNRMPTHIFLKLPSLCISGECSCRFE